MTPKIHRTVERDGTRLHVVEAGTGPPVVLLHGFPETHRSWDLQVPALVSAGFCTLAVDLRGYGQSSRPRAGYDLPSLADDVAGVVRELGTGKVAVVGHDWGGAITWELCARHAELFDRAVILACPHPWLMLRALRRNLRQLRRSWYMFFFQLPRLPERWLSKNGGANLARMFRDRPPQTKAEREILDAEVQALLETDALPAALAYYRQVFRDNARALLTGAGLRPAPLQLPVTLVWGQQDSCLGTELIHGTNELVRHLHVHVVEDAGHFVHQERPDQVNALLVRALTASVPSVGKAS